MQMFLLSVYDWLAHVVGRSKRWGEYDTTLRAVIDARLSPHHVLVERWIDAVIGSSLTTYTLLNRHYLAESFLSEEILTKSTSPPLFVLMASMLTDTVIFSPLYRSALWEDIDNDPHPINVLRQKQPMLRHYTRELAMREDITSCRLVRDHGLLSSFSLLYGLYLIRVVLIYEMAVRPDEHLSSILMSLSNTLTTLKGVFNNVEANWLGTHVR